MRHRTAVEEDTRFNGHYTVAGSRGIAFYVRGWELERIWNEEDGDCEERRTGNVIAIMVGDDREHSIDPDDLTPIDEEAFCASCGQVGCGY